VRFEIKSKPKQRRVKMYNECLIDEVSYKGYRIKTYQDDEPDNPRDWDNLGKIFYGHKRYVLGEVDVRKEFEDCYSWDDVEKRIIELYDPLVILPLYLYDHGILRIKIGDFYDSQLPQGYAHFDTGMVGFVIAERDKVRKEYGVQRISKKLREQVKQILEDEIDVFDKYLSGQVYAYSIEDTDIACSGFYDYDEMVKYAKEEVDGIVEKARKDKQAKLKAMIKNSVPIDKRQAILAS
jgi:hypothetical protein